MVQTTTTTTSSPSQRKIQVILDTNIIKKLLDKNAVNQFLPYLQELLKRNGTFVISDFTIFELIRGATIKNENDAMRLVNVTTRLEVNADVLIFAGRLETLYKVDGYEPNSIDEGDKIIAATSFLNNTFILTSNCKDFPPPYFKETERKLIEYKKNKRNVMVPIYLLLPDYNAFNLRFNARS